jgi:mono/diheme cytochrome c family protein
VNPLLTWIAVAVVAVATVSGQAPTPVSYTRAQAARGEQVYQQRCAACHGEDVNGDGNGITPALFGPAFAANWGGLPLSELLQRIQLEAGQSKPAGLTRAQQADVLAFLLQVNEIVEGPTELPADLGALSRVRLSELTTAAAVASSLPPAFPRKNATKLFETDRFVVWDIVWPKGEPTPLHRHRYDQVGTYYVAGGRRITTPDGESRTTMTEAGSLSNTRAGTTHIEEGTTEQPLRAVFIELTRVPERTGAPVEAARFEGGTAKQLMTDERVTAWEFTPAAQAPFTFRAIRDTIFIWLGTGKTQYIARGAAEQVQIQGPSRAVAFEIK